VSTFRTVLLRVSGRDRPGITAALLEVLATHQVPVYDMEQVVVRERLTLDVLVGMDDGEEVLKEVLFWAHQQEIHLDFEVVEDHSSRASLPRFAVTVIGQPLTPEALARVTRAIAAAGGNIDRIVRLARYPVTAFEFVVVDGDLDDMRARLVQAKHGLPIDVAVQRESLERRAKRLVVMDVDSTLIQDEVIDLLAEEAGCLDQMRAETERAMRGELEFSDSLRQRVAWLAGTPAEALDRVRERVRLTPGARTFVRTLRRLGYEVALVSGGFQSIVQELGEELGVQHVHANRLEVVDGVITGRLVGDIIDREGKARVLREIAAAHGIALEQTVAVGDGANDLDMLAAAGLGIAFNAKDVVRDQADTSLTHPYLDAVLFLLGIRREDVEAADQADPDVPDVEPVPVPGTPPA
jgi:phosphoserine phosphatase